jgi:hypothetical protein
MALGTLIASSTDADETSASPSWSSPPSAHALEPAPVDLSTSFARGLGQLRKTGLLSPVQQGVLAYPLQVQLHEVLSLRWVSTGGAHSFCIGGTSFYNRWYLSAGGLATVAPVCSFTFSANSRLLRWLVVAGVSKCRPPSATSG